MQLRNDKHSAFAGTELLFARLVSGSGNMAETGAIRIRWSQSDSQPPGALQIAMVNPMNF